MPLRIVAADKPKRQAVTRFRSTGPEGKSHSTKEGRSAEAQRAYMRKHGPQKPRRKTLAVTDKYKEVRKKLNPFATAERRKAGPTARGQKKKLPIITVVEDSEGLKDAKKIKGKPHSSPQGRVLSHIRTSSPFVVKKATGGRIGLKKGSPDISERFGGSKKGKPHSTKEGRVAAGRRRLNRIFNDHSKPWPQFPKRPKPRLKPRIESPNSPKPKKRFMTPLRAKKGVGGIAKIIGKKAVDWIKKNRKTIKKEIYSPEGKKKTQDLTKKLQEGLKKPGHAKGGRIGLQHGNRPRPQGPHTWVKSGGAVLKGKKVGIQIK